MLSNIQKQMIVDNYDLIDQVLSPVHKVYRSDYKGDVILAFCEAAQKAPEDEAGFRAYCYNSMRYNLADQMKANAEKYQEPVDPDTITDEKLYLFVNNPKTFDYDVIFSDLNRLLHIQRDREIVRMLYLGYTQKEISEHCGVSEMTISRRLRKIQEELTYGYQS